MNNFCKNCQNLLCVNTSEEKLSFKCMACFTQYPATDNDSLRFEEVKDKKLVIFTKILENSARDPVNLKVYKKCSKCNNNIAKQVRLGDELQLINICERCNFKWLE